MQGVEQQCRCSVITGLDLGGQGPQLSGSLLPSCTNDAPFPVPQLPVYKTLKIRSFPSLLKQTC